MMVQLETRREVEREPEQREIATQLTRLKQRIHDGQVCQRLSSPVSSVYQTYTVTEPGVWRWGGGYTKIRTYRRPFTSAVCTSLQIWTNYETHIFK